MLISAISKVIQLYVYIRLTKKLDWVFLKDVMEKPK